MTEEWKANVETNHFTLTLHMKEDVHMTTGLAEELRIAVQGLCHAVGYKAKSVEEAFGGD